LTVDVGAPTLDDLLGANLGVVDRAEKMSPTQVLSKKYLKIKKRENQVCICAYIDHDRYMHA
jgi:hypothetical protein